MSAAAGTQSVDRAAQLLAALLDSEGPLSLRELADAADLPKSTASRLLSALERHGLVHQAGQRGELEPGPAILRFAHRGGVERNLLELSQSSLEALSDACGETVNVAVPTPYGVEHLAQVDARHFLGAGQWVGRRVEFHCTANGKVFLAYGAAQLPPGALRRRTPSTITDRALLARSLEQVRSEGLASAVDELEVGLAAVAAPVFGPTGQVIAALSLSGPTQRMQVDEVSGVLVGQARELSERLGHVTEGEQAA
jgi:DNA-binding IclR family transcriptional regulator